MMIADLNEVLKELGRLFKNMPQLFPEESSLSCKAENYLYLLRPDCSLSCASADEKDFLAFDRPALSKTWNIGYYETEDAREKKLLEHLRTAFPANSGIIPNIEILLHNLFYKKYVLHMQAAVFSALSCSAEGEDTVRRLFPRAAWIPSRNGLYQLAQAAKNSMDAFLNEGGCFPSLIFVESHGAFFAADSADELIRLIGDTYHRINSEITSDGNGQATSRFAPDRERAAKAAPVIRMLSSEDSIASVAFKESPLLSEFLFSPDAFSPLLRCFSPEYYPFIKETPLFISLGDTPDSDFERISRAFRKYQAIYGETPAVVAVERMGIFACGSTIAEAERRARYFTESCKTALYAGHFGGCRLLTQEQLCCTVRCRAECICDGTKKSGRLPKKIAIVTGSAQGFGRGIAEALIAEGAYVVIADRNAEGASSLAAALNEAYGSYSAMALSVDVTDEESVSRMIDETVLSYGGLDIFVNNAGIVRAGALEDMTKSDFELVTSVNYTAYFMCVKHACRPMKLQNAVCPDYMTDIIEINSKSGLAGSNKNFAYAGSKFGGIGLTQSFALELIPYSIKVNAVCPGNFLDGPLWSDPEKGLFVQYLEAGKVPGAKTVEDVRKYYESKTPIPRGCQTSDVAKAILYIVEQKYETGQAVPVTGGQHMLK